MIIPVSYTHLDVYKRQTLSIIKNTRDTMGALQKVYYNENVYRAAPGSGYREIMQTGLECIGQLDTLAVGEVLALRCV